MSTKAQLKAWNDITQNHAQSIEEAIILILENEPNGATKEELINALNIRHQTITSRLSSLQDKGKLIHTDSERNGCTVFFMAPENRWNYYSAKRKFKKFQEFLNRGVKEFGMDSENVGPLLKNYLDTHELASEPVEIKTTHEVEKFHGFEMYASFHRVQMAAKRRTITATFNLTTEGIRALQENDEIIINGRTYKAPEWSEIIKLRQGLNQMTLEEINPKF